MFRYLAVNSLILSYITLHTVESRDYSGVLLVSFLVFDDLNDFKVQRATNNDFPVDTIMKNWKDISTPTELYRLVFKATVSSGTFVRGLAHDVCASLGIPSHAFRITRVEIK